MKNLLVIIAIAFSFVGCEEMPENAPTYGKTKVVADETLFPIVDALVKGFEHTYPRTSVEITYLPEAAAFNTYFQDSAAVIVCARKLNEKEESFLKAKKLNPRTAILANDAIAFLVNPSSSDTAITCEQAKAIFKGEITDWSQINPTRRGPITVVFDNQGSSTVSYIMNLADRKKPLTNSYALKTTQATVDYVANNAGAFGIVGYSWLSDYDDPQSRQLRSKIKIAGISPCDSSAGTGFYKPYAASVQDKLYSFSRQVFAINKETSNGTGTGLVAFMASEIGQRIISKSGILPAYKVEHNIELKSAPFKVKK